MKYLYSTFSPTTLRCEDIEELLAAFADGLLSPEQHECFRAHLDNCGECARLTDDYLSIIALAPKLVKPLPQGVHERLMDRLEIEGCVSEHRDCKPPLRLVPSPQDTFDESY